jgi:hypothetical protein
MTGTNKKQNMMIAKISAYLAGLNIQLVRLPASSKEN